MVSDPDDPYEVLGLERGSDETAVRRRYLELVRQSPPDRAPERFAAVRAAYESVRDPRERIKALILEVETKDSLQAIAIELRDELARGRFPTAALLALAEIP